MAKYISNKTIKYNKRVYEIFWQTDYINHINLRLQNATLQHLSFAEIQDNLPKAIFTLLKSEYIALFRIKGVLFQAICYLEKTKNHYRCVVKTAYRSTKLDIFKLAKQLGV